MSGKKLENETIDDSWIDIAVYAVIAILLRGVGLKSWR